MPKTNHAEKTGAAGEQQELHDCRCDGKCRNCGCHTEAAADLTD